MTPWHDRRRFTGFLPHPGDELLALVRRVKAPPPAPGDRSVEEALLAELEALRVSRPERVKLFHMYVGRYGELLEQLRSRDVQRPER